MINFISFPIWERQRRLFHPKGQLFFLAVYTIPQETLSWIFNIPGFKNEKPLVLHIMEGLRKAGFFPT
jgi:hypothetical protein